MFNGTYTVKVKRNRGRYLRIQNHVRETAKCRRELEQMQRRRTIELVTCMAVIRKALDLPIPEEELEFVDLTIFDSYPFLLAPDWVKQALKYLSPDFTIEKLYAVWMMRDYDLYGQTQIWDWMRTRHAIVRTVGGEHYDCIPSCYYSYNNEDFFFDPAFVVNPKDVNCTGWKYVGPHVLRPELKKGTKTEFLEGRQCSWWKRFLDWSKCRNYQ